MCCRRARCDNASRDVAAGGQKRRHRRLLSRPVLDAGGQRRDWCRNMAARRFGELFKHWKILRGDKASRRLRLPRACVCLY